MYLKVMERSNGDFRIIECTDCAFRRHPEPAAIIDSGTNGEYIVPLHGPAYLLNERGDTIQSFTTKAGT